MTEDYTIPSDIPAGEQTGSAPTAYSRPLTTTLTTPAEEQQAEPNDNLERYNQIVSFLGKGSKLSAKKTAEELTQSDLDAANTAYLEKINSHMESIGAEPFPDLGSVDFDAIAKKEEEYEVKSANERLKNLKTKYPPLSDIPEFTDKKDLSIRSKDIMKKIQQISASGSISDYNKKVKDLNKSMPGVALKEATSSSDIEKVSKYNQGKYEQYVSTSQKLSAIANTPYRVSSQGELLQSQEEIKKGVADIPAKMYREYQRGQAIMSKNPFVTPESKNLYFSKATSPEKVGYQWDKHTPGPKPAYTASLKPGMLSEEDQRLSNESDVYSSNIKSIDQTLRDLAKKENEVKLYGVPVMGVNGNEELRKIELERTAALAARRVLVDKNADVVTSRHEVRSKIGSTPGAFIYSAIESSSNILNGISDIVAKYGANKLKPMFSALAIASGDELSKADEATKNIEDQISQKYDEFYESINKTASSALGQAPENIEKEHKTAGFLGSMIPYVVGGEFDFPMMFASSWHENKKELEGQDISESKKLLLNMSLSLASASLMKYGMKVSKGDAYVNNLVRDAIESQTGKIEASVVNSYIRRNAVRYAKEAAIGSASTAAAFAAINPTSIAAASSIKYLSNLFPGREVDVDNLYDTASHMGESILSGIQDGLIFGGIMHTLTTGRTDFSDYNDFKQIEAFTDPRYRDALKSKIQQNLAEGIIDKAQADAMLKNIKEISDKLTSIPDSFSGRDKFEAYRILRENERISKESENLDPTFKELYQKRIDANKEKLKQLSLRHDQVYQHEKEGGSTFVRGRNQLGEKVSSVSIFPERTVKIEGPVTQEDIDNFKETNKDLLEGNEDILSVGTWKDENGKTYIDISAITPHAEAEALGRMYNQKAVFNLEKNKEVPTGGTGEPMEGMKSEADRVKDIRELVGRTKATEADFKPIGVEEVASKLGEKHPMVRAVNNAMSALTKLPGFLDNNTINVRFHDSHASMQHALNIGNAADKDAKLTRGNFAYKRNDKGGYDISIDFNLKKGTDEATVRHEFTHGILLHAFGEDPAMLKKIKDAFRSYGNMFNDSKLLRFADMYKNEDRAEEYLAELSAISKDIKPGVLSRIAEFINNVAAKYLGDKFVPFKDVNDANDIIRYFGSLSNAVRTGKPVEIREMKKQAEKEIDPEVLENGLSTNIGEPSPINEIDVKSKQSLSFPKKPLPLSFVTDKDIVDMDDILKDIYDNGKTVWFWMADQLGRGMYRDEVLNGEHYLDAGPSFALDPENRNNGILWASGLSAKYLAESAEKADYIFFISGSPEKAKMFNKAVLDLVGKRIDAGIGFDKFKKGVKKFGKKTEALSTMIDILDKYNSFKDIVNSTDRKPFLLAIDEIRQLKTTPKGSIKQFLEKSKAIVNPNELRDGFYKDNGFEQNDIMLIGKPTGAKEGSSHGTYLNTVLGEVIGVPSKKINAWELMPEDVKKKYPKAKVSQKAKIIAAEMGKFYEGKGEERELAPKEPKSKQRLTDTERELLPIRDGWYSGIEKRLIGEKSEKQSAAKWLAGPVIGKGDEAIYTGVRQWLESKNPQDVVTKSEISKWMKENPIEIREIVKGAKGKMSQEEMDDVYNSVNEQLSRTNQPEEIVDFVSGHLNSWYDNPSDSNYKTLDNSLGEINMSLDDFIEGAKDKMDDTRYHKYQLPGDKTDYKEVLVTLPISKEKKSFEEWVEDKYGETIDGWSEGEIRVAKQQYNSDISSEEWAGKQSVSATKNVFKSTHFDEPNILVHLRMNTRTDADGNKILFLEEVQSDWGQTGKKEGFANISQPDYKKLKTEYDDLYDDVNNKPLSDEYKRNLSIVKRQGLVKDSEANVWFKPKTDTEMSNKDNIVDIKSLDEKTQDAIKWLDESLKSRRVKQRKLNELKEKLKKSTAFGPPEAPFVTDTKAWTKLGLKMAIKEAIRQGVDKIAWTTGEQQADRYDLRDQVDYIDVFTNDDGTYEIQAVKGNETISKEKSLKPNQLEGLLGKDLAKKIIEDTKTHKHIPGEENLLKTYRGDDLKVGGEGMKGFYDNIVPNSAKSLVKELTGKEGVITQVKFSEPKNQDVIDRYNRARQYGNVPEQLARDYENALGLSSTQQAIDITPELKAAVEEGLPIFSKQQLVTDKKMIKKMTEDEDGNYLFYHYSPNKIAGKIDPRFFGRNPKTGRDERPGIGISMYYTRPDYRDVGGNYGYVVRVPKDKVYPFNEDPLNLYDKAEATFQKMYPGQAFDPNKQVAFIAQEAAKLGYDMTVAKWGDQLRAQTTKPMKGEWYEKPHPEYRYSPVYNPKLEGFQANEKKSKVKSKQRLSFGDEVDIEGVDVKIPQEKEQDILKADRSTKKYFDDKVQEMKPSGLSKDELKKLLDSDNMAILTGTNPDGNAVDDKTNDSLNKKAEEWLKENNYKYHEVTGKYGQTESSFIVEGMTAAEAMDFAERFKQDSVAHSEGLVYRRGAINRRDNSGDEFGVDVTGPEEDFVSAIKTKDGEVVGFKIGYDFDKEEEYNPEVKSKQRLDEEERLLMSEIGIDRSSIPIDKNSKTVDIGEMTSSNGGKLKIIASEINLSYPGKKKFIRKIEAIDEKNNKSILSFWEDKNNVIIVHVEGANRHGTDLIKKLIKEANDSGVNKIIADDVESLSASKYWENKLGFSKDPDVRANRILDLSEYRIAKEDGSNPKLVKTVDDIIGESEPKSKQRLDDTGMKFKDEVQKEFDRIKDTDEKGRLIDRAISKASDSWAKWIRDNQDQYDEAVRQFKKDNGIKVKSAPSQEKISGQKPSMVTVKESTALKDQIKLEARAAREGAKSIKDFIRSVSEGVKSMVGRGVITANQASAITKRMAFLNPKNTESLDKFYKWVDKIFSNADYADKLKEASTNRGKIKGKLNSKEIPTELVKIAKRFSKIDPSEVSDIDEYNKMSKMLWEGLRPNVMKRDKYGNIVESKREAVNMKDMNRYIESQEDAMQKKKEKAEKAAEEDPEIIQNLKDSIDQLSDIARSILETGINPIDGTSVDLTSKEKSILKKFLDMKPKEKKTLMDTEYALKHFIENGDTGLMEYARERYDIDRKVEAGINALKRATGLGIKRLPVEWVISAVRSLKNIIPTKYEESMRDYQYLTNSSISRIDTLLRNIEKGSPVFKTLFRDIAAGYSFYKNKTKEMNSEKIYQKMLKGLNGDIKKAAIAKYKITMYLRQLEHESNPGSSKSLPAMDYMKATIEAAKLGTNKMSKYSRKVLEKLIQEYSYTDADGVQHIDKDKIYDSLSEPEKNAVSEIQKLYKDLLPFAKTVAEKIRNNPFDEISNYVSIAVNDSSLSAADINTLATEMQAYLPSSLSTKAGQIEDRTGVARSIDMDPFSTVNKAVRNILLDHSMTSNIMALRRITKDFREESVNGDDDVRLFAIALDNVSNEVIKSVVGRSYTERTTLSEAMDLLTRKSVTYMLAGLEKITKETGSNIAFVSAFAPVEFANGAKYMKYITSGLGGKILEVVNSYNQDRLYPHGGDVGKVADTESYDISVSSSQNIPYDAQMIAFKAYYNTLNRAIKLGRATAEAMLGGPDIAMARPLWFGSMAMEFKRITGKEIDFDKIANSDAEYLESNMSAIEQARDVADKNVVDAANTKNPFLRSPKLTMGSRSTQLLSQINNFLSGFSRKESEVLIDSIDTLYREGQITRTQAVKTIAAVTARAATYRIIGKVMAGILSTAGVYLSTIMNDDEDDKLEAAIRKKISKNPSKMETEAAQVEKGYFTEYSPKIEGIDTSINVTNRFMTSDEEAVAKMDKRLRPKRTLLEEGLHGAASGIAQLLLNRNFGNLQNSLITAPLFEEYINSKFINNKDYDKYEDQYLMSNLPSSKQDLAKELLGKTSGPLSLPISGGIDLFEEIKEMISITNQLEDVNNKLKDIDAGTPVKEFGSKDKGKLDSDKKKLEERYEKSKRIVATKISIGAIGSLTAIPGLKDIVKVAKKTSEDVIIKTTDWDKLVKWYEEAQKQVKGSTIPAGVTPAFNRQPQQSQYFKMTSKGYKLGPKGWYK